MDGTKAAKLKTKTPKEEKKRKLAQKIVVTVKVEGSDKQQKNEGPPSDSWSWRKYGQKPIKGSPYPRGYYRCSTSKGCSAKKQVEKCRNDPSVVIITYTSSHNHEGPDLLGNNKGQFKKSSFSAAEYHHHPRATQKQEEEQKESEREKKRMEGHKEGHFPYYQSPLDAIGKKIIITNKEERPFNQGRETNYNSPPNFIANEKKCSSFPHVMTFSAPKSEESDFYDELEELPTSSFFSSFMKRSFFEERILVNPS